MKLLIVASWFPDPESPFSGVFIAEQARALAATNDLEVIVLAPTVIPAGNERTRLTEERDGYQVVRVGLPARSIIHQLDYARAIVAEIKRLEADVVHAHVTLPAGFASVLAGNWTGRPVVITEHRGPFSALMETPRDRFKVRFALERADAVIAVSSALAQEMYNQGIRREIRVVPNVVDPRRFAESNSERRPGNPFNLLFAGILRDHNKNLPLLLRAMKILNERNEEFRLTIVGDGKVREECERLSVELGVAEQCAFLGALPPDALASELRKADLFVLPSRAETFGIVAAEALSIGRPVVSTHCGGPEDFIDETTGALVPVDDEAALATAIHRVATSLEQYPPSRLSSYAQQKFGDQAVSSQLSAIYREVIHRPVRSRRAALAL